MGCCELCLSCTNKVLCVHVNAPFRQNPCLYLVCGLVTQREKMKLLSAHLFIPPLEITRHLTLPVQQQLKRITKTASPSLPNYFEIGMDGEAWICHGNRGGLTIWRSRIFPVLCLPVVLQGINSAHPQRYQNKSASV